MEGATHIENFLQKYFIPPDNIILFSLNTEKFFFLFVCFFY